MTELHQQKRLLPRALAFILIAPLLMYPACSTPPANNRSSRSSAGAASHLGAEHDADRARLAAWDQDVAGRAWENIYAGKDLMQKRAQLKELDKHHALSRAQLAAHNKQAEAIDAKTEEIRREGARLEAAMALHKQRWNCNCFPESH